MRSKNYGVQYDSWRHPFSPYRQVLKDPSAPIHIPCKAPQTHFVPLTSSANYLRGLHFVELILAIEHKPQYDSWRHPFSPYRQVLKDPSAPWLALKGQPGGLSYKVRICSNNAS
jgi:hypothetical protein